MYNPETTEQILRYIQAADPRELWKAVFGSYPEHSDVADGPSSSAATALEDFVASAGRSVRSADIGCPVEYEISALDEDGVALIRQKLMSAVVLHGLSRQCSEHAFAGDEDLENNFSVGVVSAVTTLSEVNPILAAWGVRGEVSQSLFRFGDDGEQISPIYLRQGNPEVRVRLHTRPELQARFINLIDQTVIALLTEQKNAFSPDIFVESDSTSFPTQIRFGDDDERARLNAILEYVGGRIDADGGSPIEVLEHAPFRRTLAQKMADRTIDYMRGALACYGFVQNGPALSARFSEEQALLPVMYRLLGDAEDSLERLLHPDVVPHAQVLLPSYPEDCPELVVLPPVERVITDYCDTNGGSDACLISRKHTHCLPPDTDLGDIHEVTSGSSFALKDTASNIKDFFKNDIIARGNS